MEFFNKKKLKIFLFNKYAFTCLFIFFFLHIYIFYFYINIHVLNKMLVEEDILLATISYKYNDKIYLLIRKFILFWYKEDKIKIPVVLFVIYTPTTITCNNYITSVFH